MKRFLLWSSLAAMLLVGTAVGAAAPTNFAGAWSLDKSKSKDLPAMLADNIESYTLTVTQDEKQLTVETKINWKNGGPGAGGGGGQGGGQGGPSGGGGGGRGRGGMGMGMPSVTYKLDGSETTVESTGGRPGSATLKAVWADGGKALDLSNVRKFSAPDGEMTQTTKERWELSADGKTLTIQRSGESRRGPMNYTLVFNKQ